MVLTSAQLRAAALGTLAAQPSLQAALDRMGFLQADPIRAPARAQDLALMQRVSGYRAGDLERLYPALDAEEDMLPNYGFVPRRVQALLHPRRVGALKIETQAPGLLAEVLAFVEAHPSAEVHPREVQAAFGPVRVGNAWGGQSSASTRALDGLHYQGLLRISRRISGVRLYSPAPHLAELRAAPPQTESERARAVVRLLAQLYGPLPQASLSYLLSLSGYGLPHLRSELRAALKSALDEELSSASIDGLKYVWLAGTDLEACVPSGVRMVGPFDPLVWDRRRFAHLHGWIYKLEAYTPPAKRVLGYYALPLFWNERAVGWANLKVEQGELKSELHFVSGVRQTAALKRGVAAELERYESFLQL
ncbi:DNA glycosylase AlkZ-like family protein [Deinococcus detaillensis]|nr:crosslink repair DNA glycosylase YcaQ family protein [Deinococcus detaillensis]